MSQLSTHFAAAFNIPPVRVAVPPTTVAWTEGKDENRGLPLAHFHPLHLGQTDFAHVLLGRGKYAHLPEMYALTRADFGLDSINLVLFCVFATSSFKTSPTFTTLVGVHDAVAVHPHCSPHSSPQNTNKDLFGCHARIHSLVVSLTLLVTMFVCYNRDLGLPVHYSSVSPPPTCQTSGTPVALDLLNVSYFSCFVLKIHSSTSYILSNSNNSVLHPSHEPGHALCFSRVLFLVCKGTRLDLG